MLLGRMCEQEVVEVSVSGQDTKDWWCRLQCLDSDWSSVVLFASHSMRNGELRLEWHLLQDVGAECSPPTLRPVKRGYRYRAPNLDALSISAHSCREAPQSVPKSVDGAATRKVN